MSTFTGPQGKGAMRRHREKKRLEAQERQAAFDANVARIAAEQNVTPRTAREVARRVARSDRKLAAVLERKRAA